MKTDIDCAIELTEETAMQTKVSLHSFIEKNKWFKGTVYLLTLSEKTITQKTFSEITAIYSKAEILNVSEDSLISKTLDSIKNKSKEPKSDSLDLLKLGVFLLAGNVLYLSHRSLFLSDVSFITGSPGIAFSQALNVDSSSIFYISSEMDGLSILTCICNLLIDEDTVFSKRRIHSAFLSELKAADSVKITQSSKICTSSSYPDRYFTKLKSVLPDIVCIHFEEKIFNNPLYTKINQLWLHRARLIKMISNRVIAPNRKGGARHPEEPTYMHPTVRLENSEKNFEVSIIIPAHKAAAYIEACLDSIVRQTTLAKMEILIGVDNCESTLAKLKQIRHKYSNLTVFYSKVSLGAYVMRNSISEKAKYDNFLFFDADDIMLPSMVSSLLKRSNETRPIRFKYINFNHGENPARKSTPNAKPSHGVFFISRGLFNKIGGFQDWPCGADTEFMKRCSRNGIQDIVFNFALFYRRVHSDSLTQNPKTGYRSEIRSQINLKIKNMKSWSIPIFKVTSEIDQIS